MSNLTEASGEASGSSGNRDGFEERAREQQTSSGTTALANDSFEQSPPKRKRNLPGMPDPGAEVIALSPRTLMTTNRFVCDICNKGFQRDQNLQLHRRGHNLPWKLRQRTSKETRKRVYICPEPTCVHHDPSRALGDLTGIKKHFCRKHGEKKWKCDKCSKRYAVQSDWKAHQKTCGTREYRCDCGNLFSRRDSFITHRAFCDALAEESVRVSAHRQGCSQQSDVLDGPPNCSSGPLSGGTPAPSSPLGANSPFVGGPNDSLISTEVSKPGPCDGMRNFPSTQGGIASFSSKWSQGGTVPTSSAGSPRKGARLSPWSSTGQGPGSPNLPPTTVDLRIQDSSGSASFAMPSSKGMSGVPGLMFTDEGSATRYRHLIGGMMPLSTNAGDMYASLFASGEGYAGVQGSGFGQNSINDIAKIQNSPGVRNHLDRGTAHSSVGLPSSITALGSFGSGGDSAVSSIYNPLHHVASAQMSATALLQKAAQMGATASNPSFFRGVGLGLADLGSISHDNSRQNLLQDQERTGVSNTFPSTLPAYPSVRQPGDVYLHGQGAGSYSSSAILGQERCKENPGLEEFNNSLCGGAGLYIGALGDSSTFWPSSGERGCTLRPDSLLKRHMIGENFHNSHSIGSHGESHVQGGTSQTRFGVPRRCEGGDDRTTVDFLGVGPSGEAGPAACMGRTLSQRDATCITPFTTGVKPEPCMYQSDSLQALKPTRFSPGKS